MIKWVYQNSSGGVYPQAESIEIRELQLNVEKSVPIFMVTSQAGKIKRLGNAGNKINIRNDDSAQWRSQGGGGGLSLATPVLTI